MRATKKRLKVSDLTSEDALPRVYDDVVFFRFDNTEMLAVTLNPEAERHGYWLLTDHHYAAPLPAKYRNGWAWWMPEWAIPLKLPKHISANLTPHERDMRIIGWALSKEADDRDWCDEFESFVKRVNPLLSTPLKGSRIR